MMVHTEVIVATSKAAREDILSQKERRVAVGKKEKHAHHPQILLQRLPHLLPQPHPQQILQRLLQLQNNAQEPQFQNCCWLPQRFLQSLRSSLLLVQQILTYDQVPLFLRAFFFHETLGLLHATLWINIYWTPKSKARVCLLERSNYISVSFFSLLLWAHTKFNGKCIQFYLYIICYKRAMSI